jgi:hypothetical protein
MWLSRKFLFFFFEGVTRLKKLLLANFLRVALRFNPLKRRKGIFGLANRYKLVAI